MPVRNLQIDENTSPYDHRAHGHPTVTALPQDRERDWPILELVSNPVILIRPSLEILWLNAAARQLIESEGPDGQYGDFWLALFQLRDRIEIATGQTGPVTISLRLLGNTHHGYLRAVDRTTLMIELMKPVPVGSSFARLTREVAAKTKILRDQHRALLKSDAQRRDQAALSHEVLQVARDPLNMLDRVIFNLENMARDIDPALTDEVLTARRVLGSAQKHITTLLRLIRQDANLDDLHPLNPHASLSKAILSHTAAGSHRARRIRVGELPWLIGNVTVTERLAHHLVTAITVGSGPDPLVREADAHVNPTELEGLAGFHALRSDPTDLPEADQTIYRDAIDVARLLAARQGWVVAEEVNAKGQTVLSMLGPRAPETR